MLNINTKHLNLPTPEHAVEYSSNNKIYQFNIKRDDLIHPIISGNKWRKLKHHILQPEVIINKNIVSFGGAYSNHLLALACTGAIFNFKTTGYIRGDEIREKNNMEKMMEVFGMKLKYVSREVFKDHLKIIENANIDLNDTTIIPMGGAGELGEKGCFEIVDELGNEYNQIFVASGTGTMALGISKALVNKRLNTKLLVYPSVLDNSVLDMLKHQKNIVIMMPNVKSKFGKINSELSCFIKDFASQTGVLLDPIYNGPCAMEMIKWMQNNENKKSLLVHCGGLFG